MTISKALIVDLIGFSVCMANISGKVMDSGGVGIPGAIVKLEKGGQFDTTESNGDFLLTIGAAGISNQVNQALPDRLFATIRNGLLSVNIAERSAVEIIVFDLNGKVISNMSRSMDAGIHFIALPQRNAGVYLYKVKAGNSEFVLKGNSVSCASFGSAVVPQSSSSNSALAKIEKTPPAIIDVISVTKDGQLNYRQVVTDADTNNLDIKMITSAGSVTDVDGNAYQTVKIGNQVWMTENFRATKYNDGTPIPLDTSTVTWCFASTPKYCFYQNTNDADSIRKYGALYNWYVVSPSNPRKIAPTGWHVPSDTEWDTLQNFLIAYGYNYDGTITGNRIAKSMAAKTDWVEHTASGAIGNDLSKNNASGFSAFPDWYRTYDGTFDGQGTYGFWWTATEYNLSHAYYRCLHHNFDSLFGSFSHESFGLSIRVVRD
jgi:uncharacterized protein (TIGR02145 family)